MDNSSDLSDCQQASWPCLAKPRTAAIAGRSPQCAYSVPYNRSLLAHPIESRQPIFLDTAGNLIAKFS